MDEPGGVRFLAESANEEIRLLCTWNGDTRSAQRRASLRILEELYRHAEMSKKASAHKGQKGHGSQMS